MDSFTLITTTSFLILGILLFLFNLTHLSSELQQKMKHIGISLIVLSSVHLVFQIYDDINGLSSLLWRLDFWLFFSFSNLLNYSLFNYSFVKYNIIEKINPKIGLVSFLSSIPALFYLMFDRTSFWIETMILNALVPGALFLLIVYLSRTRDLGNYSILTLSIAYLLSFSIFFSDLVVIFWIAVSLYYLSIVFFVLTQILQKDYYYMIPTTVS